jgi:hypothetical protein
MTILNSTVEDDFSHKYHCDSCSKDITHLVRVTCADPACAPTLQPTQPAQTTQSQTQIPSNPNPKTQTLTSATTVDTNTNTNTNTNTSSNEPHQTSQGQSQTANALSLSDPLDLCIDCFANGAEVKNHKKYHSYVVKVFHPFLYF